MAHKKGGGSTRNGRDSSAQRLGVKKYGGEHVVSGNIIVTQRGTKIHPGENVRRAGNDSLYAVADGVVTFRMQRGRKLVAVLPPGTVINAPAKAAPKAKTAAPKTAAPKAKAEA